MSRTAFAFLALVTICGCKSSPEMKPTAGAVEYEVTFTGMWTAQTHPLEYPKAGVVTGPHFSGLIGTTHGDGYALIREGMSPTRGLERLSEEGKHSPLDDEIRQAIARGQAGRLIETDPIRDMSKPMTARFTVDEKFPMVSAVAMIAPSPDWFAGAPAVNLRPNGEWVETVEVMMNAWDSGGDNGTTYEAPDDDANPKGNTMLNESKHFVQEGRRVPVARLTFRKL